MGANTIPICPGTVKGPNASVSTAQTDKTGATATNLATLYTAVAQSANGQGALLQSITFTSPATTALGVVCVFKKVNGTRTLLQEIAVPVTPSSATAAGWTSNKITFNEQLNPGDEIDISTTVSQTIHASANVSEY